MALNRCLVNGAKQVLGEQATARLLADHWETSLGNRHFRKSWICEATGRPLGDQPRQPAFLGILDLGDYWETTRRPISATERPLGGQSRQPHCRKSWDNPRRQGRHPQSSRTPILPPVLRRQGRHAFSVVPVRRQIGQMIVSRHTEQCRSLCLGPSDAERLCIRGSTPQNF